MFQLRTKLLLSSPSSLTLTTILSPLQNTLPFPQKPNLYSLSRYTTTPNKPPPHATTKQQQQPITDRAQFAKTFLFIPPGITNQDDITDDMILPGSNIVIGPYAGHSQIKDVMFVKSSAKAKDCPKDCKPQFAILGRSNVGKSSLINTLVKKKEVALTSKNPGKTQLINHFLVNKSWYIVDLPGYGFARAPDAARMDWSAFTKGYFLNQDSLVGVLLLVDASVPPQKIDLDCANWLGRNGIPMTLVFTKCDKSKGGKGKRPDENIRDFQGMIRENYKVHPPWIMTSSVTGLGRDELLLHMSQLRNYWDQ